MGATLGWITQTLSRAWAPTRPRPEFASSFGQDFERSIPHQRTAVHGSLRWYQGKPLTGRLSVRDAQGRLMMRESYRDGLRHGLSMRWDENGRVVAIEHHHRGRRVA